MEVPPSEVLYEAAFISDDDSVTVITAVATCFFIAFVAVTLRLISRRLKHLSLQSDDYAAIVALIFAAGFSASIGVCLYAGLGKHSILSSRPATFAKAILATKILYVAAVVPTKLSIVFLYRRLSVSTPSTIALWLLGIWIVLVGIAGNVLVVFNCANAPTVNVSAHCADDRAANLAYGGPDVLTNLVLLCWPFQFLWGLEVDRIRKAHLAGVFALGGFACAASIVQLVYLSNASLRDSTWSATAPTIWSFVEVSIGLMASSLATLSPIVGFILPRYSSSFPSTARRRRSFISDTETAIATPQTQQKQFTGRQRARTISFKESPSKHQRLLLPTPPPSATKPPISISKSKSWRKSKKPTGADSPGFTWRCSGRPSDLEKWKSLPPPPVPSPPRASTTPPRPASPPLPTIPTMPMMPTTTEVTTAPMESFAAFTTAVAVGGKEEMGESVEEEEEEEEKDKGESPLLGPQIPVFRPVVYTKPEGW